MPNELGSSKERNITLEFKHAIANYKPQSRAWAFLYGDDMIPIASTGSSFYITHFFRKELKIRPYARWTCYFPVVGISAATIDLVHRFVINPEIIQGTYCAPCSIMKAAILQGVMSTIYPLLFAPVVTFHTADRLLTYPLPSLSLAPWEVYNVWSKMVQKNTKAFAISCGIQVMVAAFITWQKQVFMHKFLTEG